MLGNFTMVILSSDFFPKLTFKNSFTNTIRVSNGLDLDQKPMFAVPDLDPKYFKRLSEDG